MTRSRLCACAAYVLVTSQASAAVDCTRFTTDTIKGTITATNVWRDDKGKPVTFLYKINQSKGKCHVQHVEGPSNSKCIIGATLTASGWASYGDFGNKTGEDAGPMLHTKKISCK